MFGHRLDSVISKVFSSLVGSVLVTSLHCHSVTHSVCAAPGQGRLCAPHPGLSKSTFVLGENALGERLPQIPTFQCSTTGCRFLLQPHQLLVDPQLLGGFEGAMAGHWTCPSKEHRAQLDLGGCQQLFATCAAWHWGELHCPEIVQIWLTTRISGSCKSPRNKSWSCSPDASCGARNTTCRARKYLRGFWCSAPGWKQ